MSRETLPPAGMAPRRSHRHPCGHYCFCHLGADFVLTTPCRGCQSERFNQGTRQTNQETTNDQRDADLTRLYIAHESDGPGMDF